ncbi:MAG: TIGR04283 family arsenosugar biosynthesis glycosyltransferase [Planctomycetes bacterium]|nr:TIGR04283 family arsenosugar biosynthesis glycosyltransferase [Planctomycetota bacterium]
MSVSIIIPTFNEAGCIAETIDSLRRQKPREIIVVDGGSTDDTLAVAHDADRVLTSQPGRAFQMNAGAQGASGDSLLFLHADCRLEAGALPALERTLARPHIAAGCFSMRVEAAGWPFRSIDACASARVRLTGIVYGDQGLFLKRDLFTRLGGFPRLNFMEDVFFSHTLAHQGRIVVVNRNILVSPRRWQKVGLVRQTLTNWTLTALALYGVSPDRLTAHYPPVR